MSPSAKRDAVDVDTAATPTVYQVLVPYTYRHKGEDKTGWTPVGVGFPSRSGQGLNVEIRPGLSVSGRLVIRPFRADPSAQAAAPEASEPRAPGSFVYDPTMPKGDLV